jgi:hypothetical protein
MTENNECLANISAWSFQEDGTRNINVLDGFGTLVWPPVAKHLK